MWQTVPSLGSEGAILRRKPLFDLSLIGRLLSALLKSTEIVGCRQVQMASGTSKELTGQI